MSRTPASATARMLLAGCPLLTARSVTESTFRDAARMADSIRLRTIRTCCSEFCGPINIFDTEPLRYTSLAEIACGNFRGIELSASFGAGQKARLLPGRWG